MAKDIVETPLQYLDRAMSAIKGLGVWPETPGEQPITGLLSQLTGLDDTRVVLIGRTLTQASAFNDVVRTQVAGMTIGERYATITESFNSIRDDAKALVDQIDDGKVDFGERVANVWMKLTRGDIAQRFDRIRTVYLDVARETRNQIEREHTILEAYRDFRGALKQAEVMGLEVLHKAEAAIDAKKAELQKASATLAAFTDGTPAARAKLELTRDEKLRALQNEDRRYQIAKDLSDNLTVSYATSEVVMARLMQTTSAKERVYQQAISFFSTNETVFTALSASFTGTFGLHESTETLNAIKEGISKSLETLASIGGKVGEAAIKAGYGPTIRADAVKALVDSVIAYQERSRVLIDEMRADATRNAAEIRDAVEAGKTRLAALAAEGNALLAPPKEA